MNSLTLAPVGVDQCRQFLRGLQPKGDSRELWIKFGHHSFYRATWDEQGNLSGTATALSAGSRVDRGKPIPDLIKHLHSRSEKEDGGVFFIPTQPIKSPLAECVTITDDIGIEIDHLAVEAQRVLAAEFSAISGLQFASALTSGGSSIHLHLKTDRHYPIEVMGLFRRLAVIAFQSDPVTVRLHQPMRLPGFFRKEKGAYQELLKISDCRYFPTDLIEGFEKWFVHRNWVMPNAISDQWWSEVWHPLLASSNPATPELKASQTAQFLAEGNTAYIERRKAESAQQEQRIASLPAIAGEQISDLVAACCDRATLANFDGVAWSGNGGHYRGQCPFHEGKSGSSAWVSNSKGALKFHCSSCTGDAPRTSFEYSCARLGFGSIDNPVLKGADYVRAAETFLGVHGVKLPDKKKRRLGVSPLITKEEESMDIVSDNSTVEKEVEPTLAQKQKEAALGFAALNGELWDIEAQIAELQENFSNPEAMSAIATLEIAKARLSKQAQAQKKIADALKSAAHSSRLEEKSNRIGDSDEEKLSLSDSFLAKELATQHKNEYAYSTFHKVWYEYGRFGGAWTRVVGGEDQIKALLQQGVEKAFTAAEKGYSGGKVGGVLSIFRCCPEIGVDEWEHKMLKSDAMIPFSNGIYDLKDGFFKPSHSPSNYLLHCLDRTYNPEHWDCSAIMEWQAEAMSSADQDLFNWFATLLLRRTPDAQFFLHLIGQAGSGKSLAINLLAKLVGEANTTGADLKSLAEDKFATASLVGKSLAIFSDQSDWHGDLKNFLNMTGRDGAIKIEQKNQNPYDYRYPGYCAITSNGTVFAARTGDEITRRQILIEFNNKVATPNPAFIERLAGQLSAWTNFLLSISPEDAIKGIQARNQGGITPAQWNAKLQVDPIASWIDQCIILRAESETKLGNDRNNETQLYGNYYQYCLKAGYQPKGANGFSTALFATCKQLLPTVGIERKVTKQGAHAVGIEIRQDYHSDPPLGDR